MLRLRECREKSRLSQKAVAAILKVAAPSVSNWESGKTSPTHENLEKLADLYGVTTDYLLGRDTKTAPIIRSAELEPVEMEADVIRLPILGRVAAGVPIAAITEIEDYVWFSASRAKSADFFALRIHGRSMEPRIEDGDVVIVRQQDDCCNGDTCIVAINGEDATCKKVFFSSDGITLQSTNPDFPPMHYTAREVEDLPVRIVGKVEEIRKHP